MTEHYFRCLKVDTRSSGHFIVGSKISIFGPSFDKLIFLSPWQTQSQCWLAVVWCFLNKDTNKTRCPFCSSNNQVDSLGTICLQRAPSITFMPSTWTFSELGVKETTTCIFFTCVSTGILISTSASFWFHSYLSVRPPSLVIVSWLYTISSRVGCALSEDATLFFCRYKFHTYRMAKMKDQNTTPRHRSRHGKRFQYEEKNESSEATALIEVISHIL